jgi:hypothetical protein
VKRESTRTVDAAWFRSHVRPANEDSWDDTEAVLLTDPHERRRITELTAELVDGFELPIVVHRDHWWSRRLRVADGVHRSIAAMRLGIALPIRHGYPPETDASGGDIYTATAEGADPAEFLDAALSLSSFRCVDGPWVQCDVASGGVERPVRLYLTRHDGLQEAIAAQLQRRLREAGWPTATVEFTEHAQD